MSKDNKSLIYVTLFSIVWAFYILLGKYLLNQGLKPITQQSTSLLISSFFILIYCLIFVRKKINKIKRSDFVTAILSGVIGVGISGLFGILGLMYSTSINYGFLIKTSVVFTVIMSYLFLNESVSKMKLLYLIILLLGTYMVSTSGQVLFPHKGDLLIMLSASCIGTSTVILRLIARKDINTEYISLIRIVSGTLIICLIAFFMGEYIFTLKFISLLLLLSLFQSLMVITWVRTLSVASASYSTMMSMLTPVIVSIFALIFLKEKINTIQLIGGVIIVYGGIMTQIKKVANHD